MTQNMLTIGGGPAGLEVAADGLTHDYAPVFPSHCSPVDQAHHTHLPTDPDALPGERRLARDPVHVPDSGDRGAVFASTVQVGH